MAISPPRPVTTYITTATGTGDRPYFWSCRACGHEHAENGIIDEPVFQRKAAESKGLETEARESVDAAASVFDPAQGQRVLETFDFSQQAADEWRGSNNARRREIIEAVSLNRAVSDVTLCVTKRKPFDVLAERLSFVDGRGDWI